MATPIIMPRQGQTVESCIVTQWAKKVGDRVEVGDLLFAYETDKAAFEEEAKVAGTLLGIFFEEGEDVPVLTNMCVVGEAGEDFEAFRPAGSEKEAPVQAPAQPVAPVAAQLASTATGAISAKGISPRAKKTAQRLGVVADMAVPSGPHGRIVEADVVRLAQSGAAMTPAAAALYSGQQAVGSGIGGRITSFDLNAQPAQNALGEAAAYEEQKLSNMRKAIARAMHNSLSSMAQLTHNSSFDASDVLSLRAKFKAADSALGVGGITLNDIVLFAVSRTLLMHKHANAHYIDGEVLRVFSGVHLGMAVDTDRGLMVPILMDADKKSLKQISFEAKELAAACQSGTISPDLLRGDRASFTISNLGSLGVESFTPVINPPQVAILGVNNIIERVRTGKNGIELYPAMGLSLTYDHRAMDGAPASRLLRDLCQNLSSISTLLAL